MIDGTQAQSVRVPFADNGLYPVPELDEPLQDEIAPFRAEKDSVVFPHAQPIPYELIGRVTAAIVAKRQADSD